MSLIDLEKVRLIDLSLTIIPADSWIGYPRKLIYGQVEPPTKIETISEVKNHGVFVQYIETTTQSFTHYDAPRHYFEDGLANDEIPLEKFMGEAVVFNMMHKKPGEGVTAEDLESSGAGIKKGDIALIRTGWTDRAWGTREFWENMIFLSEDACDWLIGKEIKALALDFYTDTAPLRKCEVCGQLRPIESALSDINHRKFLGKGIILMEWLTNLGAIKKPRVFLICLPLKIKGSDGAQTRVVAMEEK